MKYCSFAMAVALVACAPTTNDSSDMSVISALPPVLALADMFVPTEEPSPCDVGITVRLAGKMDGDKEFRVSDVYRGRKLCDQPGLESPDRTYKVTQAHQANGSVSYEALDQNGNVFSLVDDRKSTFPRSVEWTATENGTTYAAADVDEPETSVGVRN
jgi:hypothetical protein